MDVEGSASQLGQCSGEEYEESQGLYQDVGNVRLPIHDLLQVQRLREHGNQDQENFVLSPTNTGVWL